MSCKAGTSKEAQRARQSWARLWGQHCLSLGMEGEAGNDNCEAATKQCRGKLENRKYRKAGEDIVIEAGSNELC